MKKHLFILMISLVVVSCKKDNTDPEVLISSLTHTWKHTAYGNVVGNDTIWEPIRIEPRYIHFRFDGVILDEKDLPVCCAPKAYYVNGELFKIKPKAPLPFNEQCALLDCIQCDAWNITQKSDELIVSYCDPVTTMSKYIRQ
jgi:hypothetical protein